MILPTLIASDAFHTLRLTPGWSLATTGTKTAAITRAGDYIEAQYIFAAEPVLSDLSPDPRYVKAVMVLAGLMLAEEPRDNTATETIETLSGVGSVTIKRNLARDPYPLVTAILAPLASTALTRRSTISVMIR